MASIKYLMSVLLIAVSFITIDAHAQKYVNPPGEENVVAPKLVVVQPNPGGYNLENRVLDLERATESLNRYVNFLETQNKRLERRVQRLERDLNSGGIGRISCELRVRDRFGAIILEVSEDGNDEREVRNIILNECTKRIDRRLCNAREISCRANGRY